MQNRRKFGRRRFPFSIFHFPFYILRMSWPATLIHVLDFEGSRSSGVVEYGVATLCDGKIAAIHTRLCAPAGPVAAAESALHGISAEDTAGVAPFAAEQILFAELRQSGPFAAHHAPVERALLRRAWPVPPAAPDFAASNPAAAPRVADWGPWLDTRRIYESLYPNLPSYQLADLVATFALAENLTALATQHCPGRRRRPHCALFDALAAALLLARLTQEPSIAGASLAWLLAQSVPPDQAEVINQGEFLMGE
jgi:DNA polymerase III epsilon subunit-like protein